MLPLLRPLFFMKYKLSYKNNSLELLIRILGWIILTPLIVTIPWVINDQITYFAKGFELEKELDTSTVGVE